MNSALELEVYDSDTLDGRASGASSEWAHLSVASDDGVNEPTAKDVAACQELWEAWANNLRISTVNSEIIKIDHGMVQIISGVFKHAHNIPQLWSYIQPAMYHPSTDRLQERLVQIAVDNPGFLAEANIDSSPPDPGHALTLATAAFRIHETALRVSEAEFLRFYDDAWAIEVHDLLILRCAQGRVLGSSHSLSLPVLQPDHSIIPELLTVDKIRPRGVIPILSGNHLLCAGAFSTRSQVTSHLLDRPVHLALHAFNNMATKVLLTELAALGINMPFFGVLCDRNIVRFHVDWDAVDPHGQHMGTLSLPLPQIGRESETNSFREFDLTRLDDTLRVVFILDAMHAYSQHVLLPAVRARVPNTAPRNSLPLSQGEITSEEKVAAWMHSVNE